MNDATTFLPAGRASAWYALLSTAAAVLLSVLGFIVPLPWSATTRQQMRITMVCVSGFSWDRIIPLHRQGQLPFIARLFSRCCAYGDIVSPFFPGDTAILATLFTGRLPAFHGIHRPEDLAKLTSERRQRIAIWDELATQGQRCAVIGFPVAAGTSTSARNIIFKPAEQHSSPEAARGEYEHRITQGRAVPSGLRQFLRACISSDIELLRFAVEAVDTSSPAHLFAYFEGLGRWQERLASGVDKLPEAVCAELIDNYYVFFDAVLSALQQRMGKHDTFLLLSERGNLNGCPTYWKDVHMQGECPAVGFFYATGRHIREGAEPLFIKPADIVPTLVYLAGTPVRNTMNGIVNFDLLEDEFYFQHKLVYK